MAKGLAPLLVGKGTSRLEYWAHHLAACAASGVSMAQYCRDRGLSYASFQWWKGELKRRKSPVVFAEVGVPRMATAVDGAIEVVVGRDRLVRVHAGFDEATLARVLVVVERSARSEGA